MNIKKYLSLFFVVVFAVSCMTDKGSYDYAQTNEVTFKTVLEGFTFTSGENVEITAPVEFSEPFSSDSEIDNAFEISWYIGKECVGTGYKLKYSFDRSGGYSLILKVRNRSTGETYLSGTYPINAKSAVGWGWMVLSADKDDNSCLSVISPLTNHVYSSLEKDIEGGLGTGPKSLNYYYVLGSISGSYISGLPKVIVNQSSGTVTIDGNTLQKDKWLRDEFENGSEPEPNLTLGAFAWKHSYYLIFSAEGNVYLRCMPITGGYTEIPYYNTYSSMPYNFDREVRIGAVAPFHNVTYWAADEENVLMYDELSSRFLAFVKGNYGDSYDSYSPKVVYFSYYDAGGEFDPSVPKVDNLGSGTKCLALGAYEVVETDPETKALDFYPTYVALLDYGGTGDYHVYEFTVHPMGSRSHTITANTHTPFSGASILTANSIVLMSTNFAKNPYFYFTDGDRNLYVYSMDAREHKLLYTASSRITGICPSPVDCPFSNYGANSKIPNFRLALAQEGGKIGIVDVGSSKMVRLFEGFSADVKIDELSGFGDIKSVVWATNYEGEY